MFNYIINKILKNQTMDKDAYQTDIEFLKGQKKSQKMTLGSKDKKYSKRVEKRERRNLNMQSFFKALHTSHDNPADEFEFTSGTSDANTSMESSSSFDLDGMETSSFAIQTEFSTCGSKDLPADKSGKSSVTNRNKNFAKNIAMKITPRDLVHVCMYQHGC